MVDDSKPTRRDDDTARTGDTPRTEDASGSETHDSPRRRDVLRAGAAAGVLGVAGLTLNGASAQETTTQTDGEGQGGTGVFSFSLEEGDLFRVRYRPRDPFGEPATQTIPGGCLDGESDEYQIFVVRAFRGDQNLGYRGLFAPQMALTEDLLETTTAPGGGTETGTEMAGETTTEAAMQDQTTTTAAETTTAMGQETTTMAGGLPEIALGEWYRVTSSESCDGMNRLTIETTEPPETTVGTPTTTGTEMGGETTTE